MDASRLFDERGTWIIEDRNHEGITVFSRGGGRFDISAWAENFDDLWKAEITAEEVEAVAENPSSARKLLATGRTWHIAPPSSAPRGAYIKERQAFSVGKTVS